VISEVIPSDVMLPAPGQGAIAIQTRNDAEMLDTLGTIHHAPTALAVTAERAFLAGLGGGCSVPVSAHARWYGPRLKVNGRVSSTDGRRHIDVHLDGTANDMEAARAIGLALAQDALARGAAPLLEM
jgi:hydroxymethylbilane synthase